MTEEQKLVDQPRPAAVKVLGFMIASFPLRLLQFVLIVTMVAVGIVTTVIWVGIPILIAATSLVRGFDSLERGHPSEGGVPHRAHLP